MHKDVKIFIEEFGLTNLAHALSEATGSKFSAQQINHWRQRGIPYRWQDIFTELSGIPKHKLKFWGLIGLIYIWYLAIFLLAAL